MELWSHWWEFGEYLKIHLAILGVDEKGIFKIIGSYPPMGVMGVGIEYQMSSSKRRTKIEAEYRLSVQTTYSANVTRITSMLLLLV